MSAAKMVADSTQSDTENKKKKEKKAKKEKKSKKERKRRRRSSSSSSYSSRSYSRSRSRSYTRTRSRSRSFSRSRSRSRSHSPADRRSDGEYDSDVDLKKELKPLREYLRQPHELLDQMLHSVRGSSLQRALPDVLKTMQLEELRKRCLEHLTAMSRKRIKRILAGDDPATISSSGTEDDESTDDEKQKDEVNKTGAGSSSDAEKESRDADAGPKIDDGRADSPLSLHGEDVEMELNEPTTDHINIQEDDRDRSHRNQEEEEEEMEEGEEEKEYEEGEVGEDWGEEEEEDGEGEGGEPADMAEVLFPEVEQDRMELLELEMRARAIKAMLAIHEQREKPKK